MFEREVILRTGHGPRDRDKTGCVGLVPRFLLSQTPSCLYSTCTPTRNAATLGTGVPMSEESKA